MGWTDFTVSVGDYSQSGDGANECACRVEQELYEDLVEREMWDRIINKLVEILPALLAKEDITQRFDEFEVFDLYDNSLLLALRYNRTDDIWELFETSFEDGEWSEDVDDGDSAQPE